MPKGVYKLRKNHGGWGQVWPEPVLRTIERCLSAGLSYVKIVETLRKEHSFITTKNAVVGKANRMGLRSKNEMRNGLKIKNVLEQRKTDGRVRVNTPRPEGLLREDDGMIHRAPVIRKPHARKKSKEEIALARKGHIPAIVESTPHTSKPFADLQRNECRWSTALDASMACGGKTKVGSYCEKHAVLAYRTMPTRRRNATITKEPDIERVRRARLDAEVETTIQHFLEDIKPIGLADMGPCKMDPGEAVVDAFIREHVIDDYA